MNIFWEMEESCFMFFRSADCAYVPKSRWPEVNLYKNKDYHWLIPTGTNTMVSDRGCALDRIVMHNRFMQSVHSGSAGVFKYDAGSFWKKSPVKMRGLSAADVSDHYPIEMELIVKKLRIDFGDGHPSWFSWLWGNSHQPEAGRASKPTTSVPDRKMSTATESRSDASTAPKTRKPRQTKGDADKKPATRKPRTPKVNSSDMEEDIIGVTDDDFDSPLQVRSRRTNTPSSSGTPSVGINPKPIAKKKRVSSQTATTDKTASRRRRRVKTTADPADILDDKEYWPSDDDEDE